MDRKTYLRDFLERARRRLCPDIPINFSDAQFPFDYYNLVSPQQAFLDLLTLRGVVNIGGDAVNLRRLRRRNENSASEYDVRIYSAQERPLDAVMPLLHNIGLPAVDQKQLVINLATGQYFVRSFLISAKAAERLQNSKSKVLEALGALLSGEAEDDPLNKLILLSGFHWKEVRLLRAYCNYYLQLAARVGRARLYEALLKRTNVTRLLFSYFETRFRPDHADGGSLDALGDIRQRLICAFDEVTNVTDDRILRDIFNLMDATLRTNFFLDDGNGASAVALKINSLGVINVPAPKPLVEVYVHSPRMEGIHLRGAKVARGGIRWSDRGDDLRTEILDLMQTQMIKNALIVPQGAKGGFVLKTPCATRDRREELGKAAYREFISALLDLTDNAGQETQSRPAGLICYDDPDPYLVVAADKGTATWSDVANDIAQSRGFWLGNAFATGGSNGFHHKRLGITARGAWVCVRRHFQEISRNVDDQAFTVVGVGSMDGDVFGNGMLQTSNIRLLGAFSGEHIFVDPNPDPLISYDERRRLFEMASSTWADYDISKISLGGGVYRRDAKDIELSTEARSWLQVRNRLVDGEGLIRLLLAAPVDLLWMGGIGTYVKASSETDENVGDRSNDGARINASQLRARIVGEGANLGFTQHARVEFALNGGRINTDAVDNSAGVDLSDHEVNLKILLNGSSKRTRGAFKPPSDGLEGATEEVCVAVLDDNYRQSLCLSLERERSISDAGPYMDLADRFEASGLLDRVNDAFPTRKELAARTGDGLTRPELALLMGYAKLALKRALLEAPRFLQAKWIQEFLFAYFPTSIHSRDPERMAAHPLAREISATSICNKIIDQAGARFLLFGESLTPNLLTDAVGLYLAFDQIMEGERWRQAVRNLDGRMNCGQQYEYLLQLEDTLIYLCRWALQRGRQLQPEESDIGTWRSYLKKYLTHFTQTVEASILDADAPENSREIFLHRLRDFPFLVDLAQGTNKDISIAARLFEQVVSFLGLRQIASLVSELSVRDVWEGRLQGAIEERLRGAPARIAAIALRCKVDEAAAVFQLAGLTSQLMQLQKLRAEMLETTPKSIAPYALYASELESLIDACEAPRRAA